MTYDYNCKQCGIITVERSIKDKPITECPTCKGPIDRIYKASGYIAKCDGFFGKSSN